ncbi:MAG: Holliday junction resolvase RuvX [Candidatus Kerfeldbacteria bacterium]|nr:Holliday junction resolvase RuvX [Candidatus Kerfeldbacteria bacterium]
MAVIVGLDYGTERTGVAVSDDTGRVAVPSEAVVTHDHAKLLAAVKRIVSEKNAERVVVGLPLGMSGNVTAQTAATQEFICELEDALNLPVDFQDERLTSVEAERSGSANVDSRAATIMLQSYLDRMANDQP